MTTAFELINTSVYTGGETRSFVAAVYRSGRRRDGRVFYGACYGNFETDFHLTADDALDALRGNLQAAGARVRNDFDAYDRTTSYAAKASRYFAG